mmetsp:Transcript_14831/g.45301  ORF Transcript_14831/g.45301 Transcript_14831/m.45301 type:complete len:211 (-) Transcript_14831:401-1033(-)
MSDGAISEPTPSSSATGVVLPASGASAGASTSAISPDAQIWGRFRRTWLASHKAPNLVLPAALPRHAARVLSRYRRTSGSVVMAFAVTTACRMGTPVLVRIGAIVSSCATQRRVFDVGSDVLRIASRSHLKWGLASSSHHFGLPALLGPGALAEADFGFGTTGAGITSPHHSRMLLSVSTSWSRACSKSASLAFGSPSLIWRALTSSEGV